MQRRKQQHPRVLPATASADGYAVHQWHLSDDATDNAATAHVLGAWRRGHFGRGAKIVLVDDGLDVAHLDLARGADLANSYNYDGGVRADPSPRANEAHGTGAGAVAAGSGRQSPPGTAQCGHGVAPLAGIVGVRLIAEPASDADEARALLRGSDVDAQVGVYSCSWGPSDDGATLDGPAAAAAAALETGSRRACRGGKGCLYAWAADNGFADGDSCAYDGYASNPNTIAVGAVTYRGTAAWYSEACPALFVTAPSSGDGRYITTADIRGTRGYSLGDCNTGFGGTSAAAPFVAGVLALVIGANPALSARDATRILAATARRTDVGHSSWQRNLAGVWHSNRYGFGTVDALAAVTAAETWVPDAVAAETFSVATLPPGAASVVIAAPVPVTTLDGVLVTLSATYPAGRGKLKFVLTHRAAEDPAAPVSTSVFDGRPDDDDAATSYAAWPFYTVAHWGETPLGVWTLAARDAASGADVTATALQSWAIEFYGK